MSSNFPTLQIYRYKTVCYCLYEYLEYNHITKFKFSYFFFLH